MHSIAGASAWTRRFVLATIAATQPLPILLGGYVLSNARHDGAAAGPYVLFSLLLICSGMGALFAIYQDWRYRQPFNQNRTFIGAIILLGVAALSVTLFRR